MTIDQLEAGKNWVSACVEELAREMKVPLGGCEWVDARGADLYERHRLICSIEGTEFSLTFSYLDLCACSRKEVMRVAIRPRIKGFLAAKSRIASTSRTRRDGSKTDDEKD